jgi:undecaprenyl phosphate N,N'-diacetylbacillosamine 1-phosphate transferase
MYISFIKPLLDRIIALFLLILLSPLMVILSMLLWLSLGGAPLFFQKRAGFRCQVFDVIKFRTMTNDKNENGILLKDSLRLTRFGKFIRGLSLDELPQLINVLCGQMSLIGPRPFMSEYLDIYTNEELHRHDVRPGITGWAQIKGRNNLSWKQKFKLDLYYVDNISLNLDIKIALMTIMKVLIRDSVNQDGSETMEKYNGYN